MLGGHEKTPIRTKVKNKIRRTKIRFSWILFSDKHQSLLNLPQTDDAYSTEKTTQDFYAEMYFIHFRMFKVKSLRERLRTDKVFTKDQCFYRNYR